MLLAWTTVANLPDAERIAAAVVERRLAACVQIDGPIVSHFRWEGRAEREQEYRLCFKFLEPQAAELEREVIALHPYKIPEWLVVRAERVGEKYLSWAQANSTHAPSSNQ